MDWIKKLLFKILRNAIEQLIIGAIDQAVKELETEIDENLSDRAQREVLKSGITLMRSRSLTVIRARL